MRHFQPDTVPRYLSKEKNSGSVLATFLWNVDAQSDDDFKGMKESLHYIEENKNQLLTETCSEEDKIDTNGSSCSNTLQENHPWTGMATSVVRHDLKERGTKQYSRDSLKSLTSRQKTSRTTAASSVGEKRKTSLSGSNTSLNSEKNFSHKSESKEKLSQRKTASAPVHNKIATSDAASIASRQRVGSLDSSPKWSKIKDKFERPESQLQDDHSKTTVPSVSECSPTGLQKFLFTKANVPTCRQTQEALGDKPSKKPFSNPSICGIRQLSSNYNSVFQRDSKAFSPTVHVGKTTKSNLTHSSVLNSRLQRPLSASASLPNSRIKTSFLGKPVLREKSSTLPTGLEKNLNDSKRPFHRLSESKMDLEENTLLPNSYKSTRIRLPSLELKEKAKSSNNPNKSKESSCESLVSGKVPSHFQELKEKLKKREQLKSVDSEGGLSRSSTNQLQDLKKAAVISDTKNQFQISLRSRQAVSQSASNGLKKSLGNSVGVHGISINPKKGINSERFSTIKESQSSTSSPKTKDRWKSNSLCNLLSESSLSQAVDNLGCDDKKSASLSNKSGRISVDVNSKVAELANRFNSLSESTSTSLANNSAVNVRLHRLMKSNTLSDVPSSQEDTKIKAYSSHNFGYNVKNVMYSRSHSVGNIFSKSESLQTFSPVLNDRTESRSSVSSDQGSDHLRRIKHENAKVLDLQNQTVSYVKGKTESKFSDISRKQLSEKLKINLKFPAESDGLNGAEEKGATVMKKVVNGTQNHAETATSELNEQGNLVKQVVQSYEKTIASLSPNTTRKQVTLQTQICDTTKTQTAKTNSRCVENKNYGHPFGLQRSYSSMNQSDINKMKGLNRTVEKVNNLSSKGQFVKEIVEKQNSPKCASRRAISLGKTARNSSEPELYANVPSNSQNSANGQLKNGSDTSPIKKAPVPLPRKCWVSGSDKNYDFEKNRCGEDGFNHSGSGNSFIIHKLQPNTSFLWCCNTFGVCGRGGNSFRIKSSMVTKPPEENIYDAIQNCSSGPSLSPQDSEDHIYMDPFQFQPRRESQTNGSIPSGRLSHASSDNTEEGSCGSDECWVDISDTEIENQKEEFEEISQHQVRMRSLPRRGNQRVNSLRRSWRDSIRDLTCDRSVTSETSQADEWKSGEYEDVVTWEIVGGPDNSSAESTDSGHDYEAIYEFVDNYSDNHNYTSHNPSEIISKSGSVCSDTSDTGISMDSSGTRSTSAESASVLTQQNGHSGIGIENSCETDSSNAEALHLQRNRLVTRSDVHLELNAKLDKVKPKNSVHSTTDLGVYVQDRTSKPSQVKKKTFIKYILRQKSAVTYSLQKNVTSPKKETATFYVPCAFGKVDLKEKSRPLSDPLSCVSKYANGNSTIEEAMEFGELKISEYQNATVIQRKPRTRKLSSASAVKRPKTPPPLPPAVAAFAGDRNAKTTLSRTRSDGSTLASHRRVLATDCNQRPSSGPAIVYSNCQEMMRKDSSSGSESCITIRGENNRDSSCSLFSKEELESILGKDFLSSDQSANSGHNIHHIYETAGGGGEDMAPLFNGSVSESPKARGSVASVLSSRSGDSYMHANDVAYIPNWAGGKKCHGFFQEDKIKDVWIEKQQKRSSITGSEHSYLFITEHLTSPFEEEPLYQFYQRDAQLRAIQSWTTDDYDTVSGEKIYERLYANIMEVQENSNNSDESHVISSKLSAMELIRSDSMGHRTLWCEVPEVINSGILDVLTPEERRLQEALFEVITSEASYLKSLKILMEHFMQCPQFTNKYSTDCVLDQREHHIIFSDVIPVKSVSEKLMADLDKRWKENVVLSDLCNILYQHATKNFSVYVKYCSQQVYKDRILKELKDTRPEFVEVVRGLEMSPVCQGLDMHSFLMLPMQRITRYPLLVDAICNRLPDGSPQRDLCKKTLDALNKVVAECNEGARKMHRMEEMLLISRQLDFKDLKSLPLISENRWLVKRGEMIRLLSENPTKRTFGRLSKPSRIYVYLLLFTDILLVTKKKSENNYQVLDYCQRNMIELIPVEDCADVHGFKNLFQMTMLQNHEGKTVEMILSCPLESDKTRWMEALMPPHPENPGEKVYSSWDFPRVLCVQPYQALQPDELSLDELDIVNVFRKMADGWYEGERVRDLAKGWFPASHTTEIIDDHVKSRNFKQRYAFLKVVGEQIKASLQ